MLDAGLESKQEHWRELRCTNCRALHEYENIFAGRVWFKCRRCGADNKQFFRVPEKLLLKLIKEDADLYNKLVQGGAHAKEKSENQK